MAGVLDTGETPQITSRPRGHPKGASWRQSATRRHKLLWGLCSAIFFVRANPHLDRGQLRICFNKLSRTHNQAVYCHPAITDQAVKPDATMGCDRRSRGELREPSTW